MKNTKLTISLVAIAACAFAAASTAQAQILAQESFENFTGWHGLSGDSGTAPGTGPFTGTSTGDTPFSIVSDFQAINYYYDSVAHTYPANQYDQNAGFSTQSVDLNGAAIAFTFTLATDASVDVAFQVADESGGFYGARAGIFDIFAGTYDPSDLSNAVLNSPITSSYANTNVNDGPVSYTSSPIALDAGTYTLVLQSNEARSYGTYVDNFSVTETPEPSTYALLFAGIGALVFLNRRSRRQV